MEEQKKMRLGKSNARDRARSISQMPVDKKICLEKRKVTLANESCERRAGRLECMRQRLEAETPEQRVARLEQMSTLQQQRLEVVTPERRAARLNGHSPAAASGSRDAYYQFHVKQNNYIYPQYMLY